MAQVISVVEVMMKVERFKYGALVAAIALALTACNTSDDAPSSASGDDNSEANNAAANNAAANNAASNNATGNNAVGNNAAMMDMGSSNNASMNNTAAGDMGSSNNTSANNTSANNTMTSEDMSSSQEDMSSGEQDMGMASEDMAEELCGNGAIDDGEVCDGDCPSMCDDYNECTMDTLVGSAATCDAMCEYVEVNTNCGPADGCCPMGCTLQQDADCEPDALKPWTWPTLWVTLEDEILTEVNARRAQGGTCGQTTYPPAPPLTVDDRLRQAARVHSLDMATNDYFGSADQAGKRVDERVKDAGYLYSVLGQDVGAGRALAKDQVDSWMTNESNCIHILDSKYVHIGVGYAYNEAATYDHYFTQVVAAPQNP